MFAISTSWRSDVVTTAEELLGELVEIGASSLELESRIPEEQFCLMLPVFYEYELDVLSIHSFFPKPEKTSHLSEELSLGLAAEDDSIYEEVMRLHERALGFTGDLESKVLVVHLGNLAMDARGDEQFELLEQGKKDTDEWHSLAEQINKDRQILGARVFDRVLKGLERLNKIAREHDVYLGVETRMSINEVPSFNETKEIISRFAGSNIKYWIDIGHAHLQSKLGWYDLDDFYETVANETIGAHLHDVCGRADHYAPGTGEVDFDKIKKVLGPDSLKVLEVLSHVSEAEIRSGIEFLHTNGLV